jgi:flagellar hook-basal body complex protein FliE
MMIPPISSISTISPIQPLAPSTGVSPTSGAGFSNNITSALDQVQQTQNTASQTEALAAAGQGSVSDALIASTQASLATQVTVALTNRAVSAFTDVMNLQF